MAAYFIVQIEVTDPERYKEYAGLASPTIEQYGGEYLVRGGNFEVVEGEWNRPRVVVVKFSSVEQAKRWYDSPEYQGPKAIRHAASRSNAILVEGVD